MISAMFRAQLACAAAAAAAAVIDLVAASALLPPSTSVLSYFILAAVTVAGSIITLLRMLRAPRRERPRGIALTLAATGLILLAWLLRAHPEIPPDPPLIAAELMAALLLGGALWRQRR